VSNVQLTFHYERRRKENDAKDENSRILYTIDVAKDFGQKERLLVIEVFAAGEGPSATPAEPLDEEGWEDADDAMDTEVLPEVGAKQDGEKQQQESDRYAAYMDPDVLHDFLEWTQLGMDEFTTFFFLMSFPFYEHEWDLVGFVLDTVFGEAMDEDEEIVQDGNGAATDSIESIPQQDDNEDDDSDL